MGVRQTDEGDGGAGATPPLRPLAALEAARAAAVRILATDVDGTLTRDGALSGVVVEAIARLGAAGVEVIPVSGRSAGEVLGLCRYLPGVQRAIAENGAVALVADHPPRLLFAAPGRAQLEPTAHTLLAESGLALPDAPDGPFRLVDVAFERGTTAEPALAALAARALSVGVYVTWSNVHVHFSRVRPDKGAGLLALLGQDADAPIPLAHVATIGDAPNDVGLFRPDRFGVTVGTRDVTQASGMGAWPEFVTSAREATGFGELVDALLRSRKTAE